MIKCKARVFFDEKTFVHISMNNGSFFNGLLFEVTDNYLVIHDRKEGRKKRFYFEIKSIDEYTDKEERE